MRNIYFTRDYITHGRWESYWTQIDEVLKTNPKKILEVGRGSGLVNFTLNNFGTSAKTLDIDPGVRPDFIGDVRKIPLKDNSFDTVLCSQVLEHLPFEDFGVSLRELKRVAKNYIVLSLPEPYTTYFYLAFKLIPFYPKTTHLIKTKLFPIFSPNFASNHSHKWEIGRLGVNYQMVTTEIRNNGLTIVKSFCPPGNLYHRFFVLQKK